jgi:hypothetical protein
MLAAMIFVAAGLGVFTVLIKAYESVILARYHDDAEAVLQTFASQFLRLGTTSKDSSGNTWSRILFSPVGAPQGGGLLWDSTSTSSGPNLILDQMSNESGGAAAVSHTDLRYLNVTIGGSQNGVPAYVTRFVQQVKDDGTPSSTALPAQPAGQLLVATFTINYGTMGSDPMNHFMPGATVSQCTQTVSVLRSAP